MSPVVTVTVATLSSESRLMSTCVLSAIRLPSTRLSPYKVFFEGSTVVLKPHFLRTVTAISDAIPTWISSFKCSSQPDCRTVPQDDWQAAIQMRSEQILVAFLFIGLT